MSATISSRDCLQVSDVSVNKLPFPSFVRLFIKVAKIGSVQDLMRNCSWEK